MLERPQSGNYMVTIVFILNNVFNQMCVCVCENPDMLSFKWTQINQRQWYPTDGFSTNHRAV